MNPPSPTAQLESLRHDFAVWRRKKYSAEPIPSSLWRRVLQLVPVIPIRQLQKTLYDGLTLTGFCRLPGSPLDNNAVERLLKKEVLHRKNSLFYKTENGAAVGVCLMSLISTCIAAKKNPFDYLVALQKHPQTVARIPELWLPWNYEGMLKSVNSGKN